MSPGYRCEGQSGWAVGEGPRRAPPLTSQKGCRADAWSAAEEGYAVWHHRQRLHTSHLTGWGGRPGLDPRWALSASPQCSLLPCWMWPRTPDGMSRAGPQPPCLTPPSSSDPAFRPPCVQWPEQATHLCLVAHVSQCNPPPHDPQSLPSAAGSLASSGLPATQPSTAPSLPARGSAAA